MEYLETDYEGIDEKCKEALQTIREYIWKMNPELTGFSMQDSGVLRALEALSYFSKQVVDYGYEGCHYHEVFHAWQDYPVEIKTQIIYDGGYSHVSVGASFIINFKDACI